MIITVDADSTVPPYEQIRSQIKVLIESEVLAPGAKLPPIRQLAGDLGIATNTVQRAYRELELEGVVESRGRHGTVVRAVAPARTSPQPAIQRVAAELSRLGRDSGMSIDDLVHMIRVEFTRGNQ